MKMYAYTSIEPNEEPVKLPGRDGMPETSLKISSFEIFKSTQIKLYH
ncbi:hypothetical protein [Belliella pelovolcani]|nr:hypothetical protein [Belliella pelovolcani]